MTKVVAFNGSPRRDGNTAALIKVVLDELEGEGVATELVQLAGSRLRGCIACYKCRENRNGRCALVRQLLIRHKTGRTKRPVSLSRRAYQRNRSRPDQARNSSTAQSTAAKTNPSFTPRDSDRAASRSSN